MTSITVNASSAVIYNPQLSDNHHCCHNTLLPCVLHNPHNSFNSFSRFVNENPGGAIGSAAGVAEGIGL